MSICARIEADRKRYPSDKGRSKLPTDYLHPLSNSTRPDSRQRDRNTDKETSQSTGAKHPQQQHKSVTHILIERLERYNRLLHEIYGERVLLGQILVKGGISQTRVDRWRKDHKWLQTFLSHLERDLLRTLSKALSGRESRVFRCWYGLHSSAPQSTTAIAETMNLNQPDIEAAREAILRYLHGATGRKMIEKTVVDAALSKQVK